MTSADQSLIDSLPPLPVGLGLVLMQQFRAYAVTAIKAEREANHSAMETLMKVAEYLGITEASVSKLNGKQPFSETIIAAIEARSLAARAQGEAVGYVNRDELDNMADDSTAVVLIQSRPSNWRKTPVYLAPSSVTCGEAPAALPQCVRDLIAITNRDGGHYLNEHGVEAACRLGAAEFHRGHTVFAPSPLPQPERVEPPMQSIRDVPALSNGQIERAAEAVFGGSWDERLSLAGLREFLDALAEAESITQPEPSWRLPYLDDPATWPPISGYVRAVQAKSAPVTQPEPDYWPSAKVTVHDDDSVTASLYAPGLPPGAYDLYLPGVAAQAQEARPLSSEQLIALREAHRNEALDSYFTPRPVYDGAMQRIAFEAGFDRGFDTGRALAATQPAQAQEDEQRYRDRSDAIRYRFLIDRLEADRLGELAAQSHPAPPIPEAPAGWKLVSREPTPEMAAAAEQWVGKGFDWPKAVWRAMFDAAPEAPAGDKR